MSSSNKRHSILPAIDRSGPKPPVNFSSSLIISDNAILTGTHSITIQSETVVHPRCRFESSQGSILVGRRCIIQERAHIGAPGEGGDSPNAGGVVLGDYVQVEVGVVIETGGTDIGEGTLIQVGSKIGKGAKVGKVSRMKLNALCFGWTLTNLHQALYNLAFDGRCSGRRASGFHNGVREWNPTNRPKRRI